MDRCIFCGAFEDLVEDDGVTYVYCRPSKNPVYEQLEAWRASPW